MVDVPAGSLYYWSYVQGLKHVDFHELESSVWAEGRDLRKKDVENYWRGWYRSDLYGEKGGAFQLRTAPTVWESIDVTDYMQFPMSPFNKMPDIDQRWVPCNKDNKPMIKWGTGCMSLADAKAMPGQVYLAENTKGTRQVIVDCDGDHGDALDLEVILFLGRYIDQTHTLYKQTRVCDVPGYEGTGIELPTSFHLTFEVDRIVPTMHFPGMDIIGNKANSLRYWKTKQWNNRPPVCMTAGLWKELVEFGRRRKG